MPSQRQEQIQKELRKHMGTFLESETNRTSLVTVTNVEITSDLKKAIVKVSVLPETKEAEVMAFVQRKTSEARDYLKKHSRMKIIPRLSFVSDSGEKNRQRIDELLRDA